MFIIDRFEGDYAVIEVNDEFLNIPKSALPKNAKEGDVLRFTIDNEETTKRKQRINGLMDKLFK